MSVYNFDYTENVQIFTAPKDGRYVLECWGAEGGWNKSDSAGKGGYAKGTVLLNRGDILYIYVGQCGRYVYNEFECAFNGGGQSDDSSLAGGGATDMRLVGGKWNLSQGLLSRIIVAGGGGASNGNGKDGHGGGITGINGTNLNGKGGTGGTQESAGKRNGKFGVGGQGTDFGGSGGGGWFGGGGGVTDSSGSNGNNPRGGGGSGYVLTKTSYKPDNYTPTSKYYLSDTKLIAGGEIMPSPSGGTMRGNSKNGYARITLINAAPTISGNDGNLGEKNLAFTLSYSVNDIDGNELTIIEKLNNNTINTIINPQLNKNYTLSITKEMMDNLTIGAENTIEISVTDGQATAYRRYKFIKINVPPTITVSSVDLGIISERPTTITYTVNDLDNDVCTVVEKINSKITKTYTATLNKENIFDFPVDEWLKTPNGTNKLTVEAIDNKGNVTTKDIYLTKSINKIEILVKKPIQTSIAATKILVTPKWNIEGGTGEIWACNNAFDTNPTWENITTMVNLNRPYLFTNTTKTDTKWGIGIKFKISKNSGYTGEISLTGFGGAYE